MGRQPLEEAIKSANTPATDAAFRRLDAAIEAETAGRRRYPRGATFVPSDLPDFGVVLSRAIRDHKTVVVVYPDGAEEMIVPRPASRTRAYLIRLFREHLRDLRARTGAGRERERV